MGVAMEFNPTEIIRDIGLPSAALVFVVYKIVLPITNSHLAFIESLKVSIAELTRSQTNLQGTVEQLSRTLSALESRIENRDKGVI